MLNVFKQNDYEKLEDHFEEPLEVTNINATGYQVDSDSDGAAEHMFDYESVQDDETLAKLEKEKRDKSAALHTTGVLMALFAGKFGIPCLSIILVYWLFIINRF